MKWSIAILGNNLPKSEQMEFEESEYLNPGPSQRRCNYIFIVDEDLNITTQGGSVRVLSTRGKRCGLETNPKGAQGHCYWHESDPSKAQDQMLLSRLETAIKQKDYLGGAFLSGGGPGTYLVDSDGPMDLSGANLGGAFLAGAYLEGTVLKGVNLREAHLQNAWFGSADLSGSDLTSAHLWNADLQFSSLEDAELWEAEINVGTRLDGVYWGKNFVLGTEKGGRFDCAEATYRKLKQHQQENGNYRVAGEFYFREMECIRKQLKRSKRVLWTVFYKSICGYGERPTWTLRWATAIILLWGLLLPLAGIRNPDGSTTSLSWPLSLAMFQNGLSLSLITFVTLGYGNRYPISPAGEFLAGFEALSGILLGSIFVVSFAKKVIRG